LYICLGVTNIILCCFLSRDYINLILGFFKKKKEIPKCGFQGKKSKIIQSDAKEVASDMNYLNQHEALESKIFLIFISYQDEWTVVRQ
jgi:glutaredoxin-related protein